MVKLLSQLMGRNPIFICGAMSVLFLSACGDNDGPATAQTTAQAAAVPAKANVLPHDVAAAWAQAVNNHQTADGSTVAQALAYAQAKRPAKFKYRAPVGDDDIEYGGSTGQPEVVGITYWIGSKHGEGENYVDIAYEEDCRDLETNKLAC